MLPIDERRPVRSQSFGGQSIASSQYSDGRSDGVSEAETLMTINAKRQPTLTSQQIPIQTGYRGQRDICISLTNSHSIVELRGMQQCILSGVITAGQVPTNSLSPGERWETVFSSESISRTEMRREETRGALVYQLRGRRGVPLSRRLFLFVAWSASTYRAPQGVVQVVEAEHAAFPDDERELKSQFRRLTRHRMGSHGGVRVGRMRQDSNRARSPVDEEQGAYRDGEAVISSRSRRPTITFKREKPEKAHEEKYRYILGDDMISFVLAFKMQIYDDTVDFQVEIYEESSQQYRRDQMSFKRVAPIWLEPIGSERYEDGDLFGGDVDPSNMTDMEYQEFIHDEEVG
jgi:hypothetical protein